MVYKCKCTTQYICVSIKCSLQDESWSLAITQCGTYILSSVTLPDLGGGGDETGIVGAPVLSDVDRKAFVSQHNRLRRKVKPSAANMKKMVYT